MQAVEYLVREGADIEHRNSPLSSVVDLGVTVVKPWSRASAIGKEQLSTSLCA